LLVFCGVPDPAGELRVFQVLTFDAAADGRRRVELAERVECPWSPWSLVPAALRPD
jgi:hypothetical protein